MDFKDYYEILGVAPNAEKKVIQQTFRQLARKHHPDVNPGNQEAEEKFKTYNEAYQVLSDVKQRKKYDELRAEYQQWQKTGQQQDFGWQDWSARPGKKTRAQTVSAEDLKDLFGSDSPYSDFFSSLFGQTRSVGGQAASSGQRRPVPEPGLRRPVPEPGLRRPVPEPERGRDIDTEVDLTLEEAFQGAERLLEIDGRRIKAGIPAGVRTGSRVRLAGQAEPGQNGGPAGDLYLIVRILPHATFERVGDDLHLEVPVDIFTAVAGGEIRLSSLDRPLILTIPPRTNAGQSFRLRGKGMPHPGDPKTRGDLFALVRLVLPEQLTEPEVKSLQALAASRLDRISNEVKI